MRTRRRVLLSFNATTNAPTEMEEEEEPLPVRRIPPASAKRRRGNDAVASLAAAKDRFFSRKRSKRSPLPPASSFSTRRSDVGCDGEGDEGREEGGCGGGYNYFEALPDDLIVCILCKLSASASRPADFVKVLVTCKRLNGLALNSMVLAKASPKCFALKAKNWSDSSHRFLKLCADAGNIEACYTLGMIRFYCQENRGSGASLMAKAAIGSHAQALYSLAVIQFNGSGGSKSDKDLRAGVALCARAAFLGHVDALRELGHCLQDGYGVRQNVADGRRFLVQANARELASAAADPSALSAAARSWIAFNPLTRFPRLPAGAGVAGCPLLSDFGCNVPAPEPQPANKFLAEWFADRRSGAPEGELRMCSHAGCGRPETRQHEFRRCSVCGRVNYCSRACQAWDWKLRHKAECSPAAARWGLEGGAGVVEGEVFGAAAVVGGDS